MRRADDQGRTGSYSYLFKSGQLYFMDHQAQEYELVTPTDLPAATCLTDVDIELLEHRADAGKYYYKTRI
jgi:hypothetical protein